jgi:hypothetical protein
MQTSIQRALPLYKQQHSLQRGEAQLPDEGV